MRLERLQTLVSACCTPARKGDVVTEKQVGNVHVTTIDAFPSADEAAESAHAEFVTVDVHFFTVNVDVALAASIKQELIEILRDGYSDVARLREGPSYIEVGAELGSQELALLTFALGEVCGLWVVVTPARLGMTGPTADEMAGMGFVLVSGFDDGTTEDNAAADVVREALGRIAEEDEANEHEGRISAAADLIEVHLGGFTRDEIVEALDREFEKDEEDS